MKRRIIIIIVILIVGAIVNIAVAWWCAVMPRSALAWPAFTNNGEFECARLAFGESSVTINSISSRIGRVQLSQTLKDILGTVLTIGDCETSARWSEISFESVHPLVTEIIPSDSRAKGYHELASGWPMLAFYGTWIDDNIFWTEREVLQSRGIGALPDWFAPSLNQRTLPLLPIWPGFAINTLLYATVMLMLYIAVTTPFASRRTRRRRRGQCERCAYPIGVSPVCTECGAAVARKAPA